MRLDLVFYGGARAYAMVEFVRVPAPSISFHSNDVIAFVLNALMMHIKSQIITMWLDEARYTKACI